MATILALSSVAGLVVVHREPQESPPTTRTATPTHFYEVPDTQKFRFQASRTTNKWGSPRLVTGAMLQVRKAMAPHAGKGFQLDPPSKGGWGPKRSLKGAIHRMRFGLKQGHVGSVWRIRPVKNHSFVWRSRKIDIDPAKIANTEGTHAIDIVVGSTLHRFPNLSILGIYECRVILGTNILSQHAYGNAVDLAGSVALMDTVAHWQYKMTRRGWLPMSQLLYRGHDWFSGGSVYDHYNHIHDSGKPMLSGPCNRPGTSSRITVSTTPTPVPAPSVFEGQEANG